MELCCKLMAELVPFWLLERMADVLEMEVILSVSQVDSVSIWSVLSDLHSLLHGHVLGCMGVIMCNCYHQR